MAAASAVFGTRSGRGRILVASSQEKFRMSVIKGVARGGSYSSEASGGADALMQLEQGEFGTLVLDPQIDDLDVDELLGTIRSRFPDLAVMVPRSAADLEQYSLVFSGGAPVGGTVANEELRDEAVCEDAGYRESSVSPVAELEPEADFVPALSPAYECAIARIEPLPGMIGTSPRMQQLYRLARLVAPRDTAVLIVGATGTGKELIARGIHELSQRSRGPFVVVNCAAIPESLLEAELFGFTRGAFTGAFQSRLGRIHAAHGGTLLLDEIGELPLSMQAKLLRFVQEGEVQRLGSADLFRVNTRLIASTNADLRQRVREKQFREDLYYRLAVFPLHLPPLQSRTGDVLPLARHFLQMLCSQAGVPLKRLSEDAVAALSEHPWPGNVRELQHWIERAFVLSDGSEHIRAEDLAMLCDEA
jgi:DNA-binding NtrC family response regulator